MHADFREMPDMAITIRQAARFWSIEEHEAAEALCQLEQEGVVRQTRTGFRRNS
jgi:hypothetical protein